jgi:hypothetical protein
MKCQLLTGLLGLAFLNSFAQNTTHITQSGSSLTGVITQVGALNSGVISQTGTSNVSSIADIYQQGTSHQATINQNNGSTFNRGAITQTGVGPGGNWASLSQSDGSGGSAARGQVRTMVVTADAGNWAGAWQLGSSNSSTVSQDGSGTKGNFGESWQQGSYNITNITQSGAVNGLAEIFQGNDTRPTDYNEGVTVLNVTNNSASITQNMGSQENQAKIKQLTDDNIASILQINNSSINTAYIQQGELGALTTVLGHNNAQITQAWTSNGNSASAIQTGMYGLVTITQFDNAANNIALINQMSGNYSRAGIQQSTSASSNTATVSQWGNGQEATVNHTNFSAGNQVSIQQGSSVMPSSNSNRAIIDQQYSTGGKVSINQNTTETGGSNFAGIYQGTTAVTANNLAQVDQQGSSNQTTLFQTSTSGTGSNIASIGQYGDHNLIGGPGPVGYGLQDGTANSMIVNQNSPLNSLMAGQNRGYLGQTGTGNSLTLDQTVTAGTPEGNSSYIIQTGSFNSATVTQVNGVTP